jgi:hypothetical protein
MKAFIGPYPEKDGDQRVVNVQIDPDDTWNMDETLAHIILPMLKQLKATKPGSPSVDDEDLPEHLRGVVCYSEEHEDIWHARWAHVLDSMIWSFEQLLTDWQGQYYEVVPGLGHIPSDQEAMDAHEERIAYGLRMFGKYYHSLWT